MSKAVAVYSSSAGAFRRPAIRSTFRFPTSTRLLCSPDQNADSSSEIDLDPPGINEQNKNRVSRYQAKKSASRVIEEGDRPLEEYMTLPVSQYSVLDADKVERIGEDTFRVQTATVSFFGVKMTPMMTLSVKSHSTGCEVRMLDCKLEGSQVAEDANQRFACYMRNYVSYEKDKDSGEIKLTGDCVVQVAGIVPRWLSVVPIQTVNGVGANLLSRILSVAMPRFLAQLEKDYMAWAAGDDSRKPLSTGDSVEGMKEISVDA